MISEKIPNSEKLYRAILLLWWNAKAREVTPAAFIDPRGVSVDREGDRSQNDVINNLKYRFRNQKLRAVASITAEQCRESNVYVFYDKAKRNIYHSLIWESKTEKLISLSKAYSLSRKISLDFINE